MNDESMGKQAELVPVQPDPLEVRLQTATDRMTQLAQELVVADQSDLDHGRAMLQDLKALERGIDAEYDDDIRKADVLHKSLVAKKRKWTDRLKPIWDIVNRKVTNYLVIQKEERLAAGRAESLAKEKAVKLAEDATDMAHELIGKGQDKAADEIVDQAAKEIAAIKADVPVVPEKPVARGAALVEYWHAEVEQPELVPREWCTPDVKRIQAHVRAQKQNTEKIPGVRVWCETKTVERG